MTTIRLIDARRGLHQQCESLFRDKMVADQIYWYLCDGLEECEEVEPERERGHWVGIDDEPCETFECDVCGFTLEDWIQGAFYNFCPNCGSDMRGEQDVKVR